MKNLVIILFLLGNFTLAYSQKISQITPSNILWDTGNEKVTLKKAKAEGIQLSDSLTLEVFFKKDEMEKLSAKEVIFEVRWFYYMITKKQLMDSYTIPIVIRKTENFESYRLASSRKNLRKGWWEVQIICKSDEGLVEFAKVSAYQILLK
jgi:hypothetical protein